METAYDRLQYESYPYPLLHPGRLAAIAILRGFRPSPPEAARILELGCGAGGHLIPIAAFFPKTECVGVDLAASQIARGQARIQKLGLPNITLYAQDIAAALPGTGEFDYIICNGLYYILPGDSQKKVWAHIRQYLSANGIAHISCNMYPGWKLREVAQDFSQFYVEPLRQNVHAEQDLAATAIQGMQALAANVADSSAYAQNLTKQCSLAAQSTTELVYHEFLSGLNKPLYFSELAKSAIKAGFTYLGDAAAVRCWVKLKQPAQAQLNSVSGNWARYEQMADFLTGCQYRHSLWVRGARLKTSSADIQQLTYHGKLKKISPNQFSSGNNISITVNDNISLSVCEEFSKSSDPCWHRARDLPGYPEKQAVLIQMAQCGMLSVWWLADTNNFLITAHSRPKTHSWLLTSNQTGDYLVTRAHEMVRLNMIEKLLLEHCLGNKTVKELAESLISLTQQHGQPLLINNQPIKSSEQHASLHNIVLQILNRFANWGWLMD